MKRRGVGSREVTISFRGKIIKMAASQRKNERDTTIYAEQILQKLIFNIRVRREVRDVADMMEFMRHGEPSLAFSDPYIYPR